MASPYRPPEFCKNTWCESGAPETVIIVPNKAMTGSARLGKFCNAFKGCQRSRTTLNSRLQKGISLSLYRRSPRSRPQLSSS